MKKKVLVILGQTATGKSALAVKVAKKYKGEVISADSRQVYRGLNIGTGKITKSEMKGIHHWLLDVISPKKVYNVSDWKVEADKKIKIILKRSKLPIICGGSGFYINSITDGLVLPEVSPNKKLRNDLSRKTLSELIKILNKIDPERLKNIDRNNPVRIIRAIEIAKAVGKVPQLIKTDTEYEFLKIGLRISDDELKQKIYKRLADRIKKGMIAEAISLHKKGLSYERMRSLGLEYRYLADYLENKLSKENFVEKLNTEIWHYAKRQMTWFKKDKEIKWFNPKDLKEINKEIQNFLAK